MNNLLSSIYRHVDSFDDAMQPSWGPIQHRSRTFKLVRIAILDSGFDPESPLLINDNPRIKGVRNFVHGTDASDMQDEIGHGTHTLGLLLKFATCAEIYVARVANQETLSRGSYDAITQVWLILAPTQ
jgi:subtilisin family serine protease